MPSCKGDKQYGFMWIFGSLQLILTRLLEYVRLLVFKVIVVTYRLVKIAITLKLKKTKQNCPFLLAPFPLWEQQQCFSGGRWVALCCLWHHLGRENFFFVAEVWNYIARNCEYILDVSWCVWVLYFTTKKWFCSSEYFNIPLVFLAAGIKQRSLPLVCILHQLP